MTRSKTTFRGQGSNRRKATSSSSAVQEPKISQRCLRVCGQKWRNTRQRPGTAFLRVSGCDIKLAARLNQRGGCFARLALELESPKTEYLLSNRIPCVLTQHSSAGRAAKANAQLRLHVQSFERRSQSS